jgi:hypothetical protein
MLSCVKRVCPRRSEYLQNSPTPQLPLKPTPQRPRQRFPRPL